MSDLNINKVNNVISQPDFGPDKHEITDEALDKMEKLAAEEITQKYHDHLTRINVEENSGSSADRLARMARIAAKHALI